MPKKRLSLPRLPKLPRLNLDDRQLFYRLLLVFAFLHLVYAALLVFTQIVTTTFLFPLGVVAVICFLAVRRTWHLPGMRVLLRTLWILVPAVLTVLMSVHIAFVYAEFLREPYQGETTVKFLQQYLASLCAFVYPALLFFTPSLAVAANAQERTPARFDVVLLRVYAVVWMLLAGAVFAVPNRLYKNFRSLLGIPEVAFRAALLVIAAGAVLAVLTAHPLRCFKKFYAAWSPEMRAPESKKKKGKR